jgi:predicted AlkP superfamily phosphohydrolase/phosphomutase
VLRTYLVEREYPQADRRVAPDLLVGYARNYRASWSAVLGSFSESVLEDNRDRWSGDHCVASHLVPGILLSNRRITVNNPQLTDIGPTILSLFGVEIPKDMTGRQILESID